MSRPLIAIDGPQLYSKWLGESEKALREVFKKMRHDYDPTAPGLREAWENHERELFLVEPAKGEPIRYTEGQAVGVKR